MSNQSNSIGAIWVGTTKGGVEKLTIQVEINGETHRFTAFRNNYKSEDKHPDWRIVPPLDRQETQKSEAPAPSQQELDSSPEESEEDELPF